MNEAGELGGGLFVGQGAIVDEDGASGIVIAENVAGSNITGTGHGVS